MPPPRLGPRDALLAVAGGLAVLAPALWLAARRERHLRADLDAVRAHDEAVSSANATIGRELARQQAFLDRVLEDAPIALAWLDRLGRVAWASAGCERLWGRCDGAPVGQGFATLCPVLAERLGPGLARALAGHEPTRLNGVACGPARDGPSPAYWDVTLTPLTGEVGGSGAVLLAIDVTARARLAQAQSERIRAMHESEAVKDQFLAVMSHELRTPINAVTGFGSILADELLGPLSPPQQEVLEKMLAAADGLLGMVDDLLDLSLIEAGKLVVDPRPFDPADVARMAVEAAGPAARAKGLGLALDVAPGVGAIAGDAGRVGQALGKLLANAVKFTEPGGEIAVRVYPAEGGAPELVFEVADTGDGIAPEDVARLFRRFTQLDMTNTRKAGGAGLGLHLAKSLVVAHGGRIGVRSEPGRGATFWFTLPAPAVRAPGPGRAGSDAAG